MSFDSKNLSAMSLKEFGDKFINEYIEPLVISNPYLAFMVLSASIEFIGKCRHRLKNPHMNGPMVQKNMFVDAIDNINALSPYRAFNYKTSKGHSNKLYTALRCGLLHAAMPNVGIILSSEENEIERNVVGCKSLYLDIKSAWIEIKNDAQIVRYLKETKAMVITQKHPEDI